MSCLGLLVLGLLIMHSPATANYLETGVVVLGVTDETIDQFVAYQVASNSSEVLNWFTR